MKELVKERPTKNELVKEKPAKNELVKEKPAKKSEPVSWLLVYSYGAEDITIGTYETYEEAMRTHIHMIACIPKPDKFVLPSNGYILGQGCRISLEEDISLYREDIL